jgi:hypothetical protein
MATTAATAVDSHCSWGCASPQNMTFDHIKQLTGLLGLASLCKQGKPKSSSAYW